MTEFQIEVRQRCRNPLCRMKLPAPVANEREAFCTRGCYDSFYLHRCRVCEGPIKQGRGQRRVICKRAKCKNAWKAKSGFGRFLENSGTASLNSSIAPQTPIKSGVGEAIKPDRKWRIVAGELTPDQFHCATVADGPDGRWEDGDCGRTEARNRKALETEFDRRDAQAVARDFCALCGRLDDLVDRQTGGHWKTYCRPCVAHRDPIPVGHLIADDLAIPDFLRRDVPEPLQLAA